MAGYRSFYGFWFGGLNNPTEPEPPVIDADVSTCTLVADGSTAGFDADADLCDFASDQDTLGISSNFDGCRLTGDRDVRR